MLEWTLVLLGLLLLARLVGGPRDVRTLLLLYAVCLLVTALVAAPFVLVPLIFPG